MNLAITNEIVLRDCDIKFEVVEFYNKEDRTYEYYTYYPGFMPLKFCFGVDEEDRFSNADIIKLNVAGYFDKE